MAQIIPLQAVPSQSLSIVLNGQQCSINVYSLNSPGNILKPVTLLSAVFTAGNYENLYGYQLSGPSYGSLLPSADSNGNVVIALIYNSTGDYNTLLIDSDGALGQNYLDTMQIGSSTLDATTATTYQYVGGTNEWQWTTGVIALANNTQYALTLQGLSQTELQGYPALYVDLAVNGANIFTAKIVRNLIPLLLTSQYFGVEGELVFVDTLNTGLQNGTQPIYTGLGSQYQLVYLSPADLAA